MREGRFTREDCSKINERLLGQRVQMILTYHLLVGRIQRERDSIHASTFQSTLPILLPLIVMKLHLNILFS
jgi:hypothetical protein